MENDLQRAREEILYADREIASLFERRMRAVREVAAYKKEHGLPVYDEKQEALVKERNAAFIGDGELRGYYTRLLDTLLCESKKYQHRLLEGMKVAYSGVEGAFAHTAARRIFPHARLIACPSFEAAYSAAVDGGCDCAVIPVENSYAGEVGLVADLMFSGPLHVTGVYTLPVAQNLLGVRGASVSDIKTVVSHVQALSQCENYIKRHGFETAESVNTAVAARDVARLGDPARAAIASAETAGLYGLDILERNINESPYNKTRFAVFSSSGNPAGGTGGKFILLFTVSDETGALSRAVSVISSHGFNMKVLRSRPVKQQPWQYYFYVEAEGDDSSERGRAMLEELRCHCGMLKVVGRYAEEKEI